MGEEKLEEVFEFDGKYWLVSWIGLDYLEKKTLTSYIEFLEVLHPEIKWISDSTDDYQGEWFAVGYREDTGEWFYAKGDYGSCPACDWLMGISNKEEAIEFLKEMKKIIPIGKSKEEAIKYLEKEKQNLWHDAIEAIDRLINKIKEMGESQSTN